MREQIFNEKLMKIRKHNADPTKTWKNGVNDLTDRTEVEFRKRLGYKPFYGAQLDEIRKQYRRDYDESTVRSLVTLPPSVDWRDHGILTAVKDQGGCGSCWTFGTTETVESYFAFKSTGELTDLSEQQILDCTPNPNDCGGTGGCGGGTPELAYAQIIKTGGMTTEWTYPYRSYFGTNYTCSVSSKSFMAQLSGYTVLPSNKYAPIMSHIATVGPLAINVDASTWSEYESGVFNGCNQANPDIDHVVQLIGYGTDASTKSDYWLIRNSWNPTWGEQGYMKLWRSPNEGCGVDIRPQDGTGCNGGPANVTVCGTCGIWYDTSFPIMQ